MSTIEKVNGEKENKFISAVIYVKDYEHEIKPYLEKINGVLRNNFYKYEIICVNDCSTDNSVEEIKKFVNEQEDISVSVINMSYYQGKEACMNAGVDMSIGDYVFEFDTAIVQFDTEIIMKIYYELFKGYDIVNAVPKKSMTRRSRVFYHVFNKYANLQYDVEGEIFRVLSRRAINRVHTMSKTIPYRKALYANCGLKQCSLTFDLQEKVRESKEIESMNRELASKSLILFTNVAYRVATVITMMMMIAMLGIGIYTVVIFAMGIPVIGWTTLMLVLSVCFFCLFAILTIILKYLSLVVSLIFNKQSYVFESIDKLSN